MHTFFCPSDLNTRWTPSHPPARVHLLIPTVGCDGSKGSSEGFEELDARLFFDEWKSEYLMIDSCGVKRRPPPYGPPPGTPGGQARWEMMLWTNISLAYQQRSGKSVVIHDCHNGCTSTFAGPTLSTAPCSSSDASQHWQLAVDGSYTSLVDGAHGMCAGCGSDVIAGDLSAATL